MQQLFSQQLVVICVRGVHSIQLYPVIEELMTQERASLCNHKSTELDSTGQEPKDCWAVEGSPGHPKAAFIHVGTKSLAATQRPLYSI